MTADNNRAVGNKITEMSAFQKCAGIAHSVILLLLLSVCLFVLGGGGGWNKIGDFKQVDLAETYDNEDETEKVVKPTSSYAAPSH